MMVELLSGGDRRSLGRSAQVVHLVVNDPRLLSALVGLLQHQDIVVSIRAADALEKVQHHLASAFGPFRAALLSLAGTTTQPELRWHLAQIIPRLRLSKQQRQRFAEILESYSEDHSAIVRVSAMQALVELSRDDESMWALARGRIERAMHGAASERARARKLRAQFQELTSDEHAGRGDGV